MRFILGIGAASLVMAARLASDAAAQADSGAQADYTARAQVGREAFDAARSRSEVDRAQADRAAVANVGDMLEQADGVTVQRTSSASAAPIVRGLTGNRVLLRVDELRLNDALMRPGGHALLNLIDPESVQRVELVRGPASVVYGSDALGGVVNVKTHAGFAQPGAKPEAHATAYLRGASAEQAVRAQAALTGVAGPFGARVSGGRGHAGELVRGGVLGEQPFTGHDDWSLASRVEAVAGRDQRFSLAHQFGHLFDVPRTDVSTVDDRQQTKRLDRESAVLAYAGGFPDAEIQLRAHAGIVLRREWRQRLRPDELEHERERVLGYQAGVGLVTPLWSSASLELGSELTFEDIASTGETIDAAGVSTRGRGRYVDGSRYDSYALYALVTQQLLQSWTLLGGARATLIDARAPIDPQFDPEIGAARRLDRRIAGVVGSLGARWDASEQLSWMTSLLGGFRAPNLEDFQALGGGARGFTVPNTDLDEERSYTLESGVTFDDDRTYLSAFAFGSLLTGLIERVPSEWQGMTEIDGMRVQTPENASRSVLLGAELSLGHRLESGLLGGVSAVATWGETERPDADGNTITEPASKVPPPLLLLQLGWEPEAISYWVRALGSVALPQSRLSEGDRNDVRICEQGPEGCQRADGYFDLTLRAGLRVDESLELAFAIENILDAAYKTYASGAYAPGRNFILAVRGSI